MTIRLQDIDFLASSDGAALLQSLATENLSENNTLALLTRLRREFTPEEAGAALEMARLRLKAIEKFGEDAHRMFFTREALEQASDPLIRAYRAECFNGSSQAGSLIDACCGIGADSLAFSRAGLNVLGLDNDPIRIEIARVNAKALGLSSRFEVADVRVNLPESDAIFFDPARRNEQGKRIHDVERYQPPLSTLRNWKTQRIAVKLSPGVDLEQISQYGGGVEFISVKSDLKEAVLWLGMGWRSSRATLLLEKQTYHWTYQGNAEITLSEPLGWLVEPDPALLRAGVAHEAASAFSGHMLDETIAYFTTDQRPESPWLRAWQIEAWMPFNLKKLRAYLREHHVGDVTVKKRGSAVTPEELIPQLKLKGHESRVAVLTRLRGEQIVMICADYVPD